MEWLWILGIVVAIPVIISLYVGLAILKTAGKFMCKVLKELMD